MKGLFDTILLKFVNDGFLENISFSLKDKKIDCSKLFQNFS